MKKPELRIVERRGDIPTKGTCTSCPQVVFDASGKDDKDHHQHRLDVWFAKHFNAVHLREDASQAAARIVREATKD